jgi:hypothetical protein
VKTVVIPNEISFDGQSYPVTEIVESAFASHDDLEKVVIGDNVTKIGKQAFWVTPTLVEAYVGSGVVEIGESVFTQNAVTIYCKAASLPSGWNAAWAVSTCPVVWDCENNDVASDGFIYTVIDGVRYGIKDGKAIVVEQQYMIKVANILGKITYKGVEYNVSEIQYEAFDSCKALRSVTIGEGVEKIGVWAFRECSRLTSIDFADSVKTVEMAAFLNCTALTSVDLNQVETLGGYVFRGCDALTKVIMPKTLQTVGAEIFMECYDLMIYLEVYARPSGWSTSWNSWYNEVWDGSLEWDPYGCPTYVYSETEPTNASLKAWRYENGEIVEW